MLCCCIAFLWNSYFDVMNESDLREVIEVKIVREYIVELVFDDLTRGKIDLRPFLGKGIFKDLLDKKVFNQIKVDVELGTICWPNGADIAPDTLYREVVTSYLKRESSADFSLRELKVQYKKKV